MPPPVCPLASPPPLSPPHTHTQAISDPLLGATPEGRAGVLQLMAALVSDSQGASFVLAQFSQSARIAQFEAFTWKGMFK